MENLTNVVESKINTLSDKVQIKTGRLAGVADAESSNFIEDGMAKPYKIREASDTIRYDANENEHSGFVSNKTDYAMQMQKNLAGRLLNKPTSEVTQQDMYDVGNMQTIQKTADMYRSAGEPRWEAPLISGSVKPDLSMVDVPIQIKTTGKVDPYGRHLDAFINPSTGINITEEAANDPKLNAFKKPALDTRVLAGLMDSSHPQVQYVGTDDGTAVNDVLPVTRLGTSTKMKAAPGAFAGSVVGGVAGVADFLTGGRVIGGDKVEALQDAVGQKLGYNKADFQYEDAVKQKLMEEAFDKVKLMNPDTYGNVNWGKAGELFKEGVTDPVMLAQSLGLLVGAGGVGGAGVKAGIGLVSKGEKVVSAANKSKAAIMASDTLSDVEKASKVADIENGITLADKIGAFAAEGSGAIGYGAAITSQDMTEYAKNNNGELPGFARTMGMFVANTLAVAVPELATTKFQLGMDKAMNEKMQGLVSSSIGKAFAHLTVGGVVELPQETIQAVIQEVNQKWGTDKYKDKTIGEVVDESTTDILGQGLLGAAGGVQMASPKAVGYAAKIGEGKLGSMLDNQEKENANLQRAANLDAINEIKADAKAHIDKASNIMTGLDTGFDMGDRSTADVISDYVGRTSQTFSDAGIQNPEKFAYDLVARRSIQKALDSVNEETMNKVHDTIQDLHNSGKVDASELLKNDTQNIMDHFGEVLTKLNKDLKDKSDKEASVLINESNDKIQGIVSQLKARQEMYGNIRGSDGSELPAMTSLEDAIKIASDYQANKDIGVVGKEIMERGFTSINPFTGEVRDDKASINAYKEAALGALNGSKIGDDSLKVNTNIANSLVSNFASPTNLSNLDKFAESRINKLNPTASKTTKYNTESHLNSMLDENNSILDAANAIKQSAESSKLVNDKNKVEYGNKLDAIIAKTNAANVEINKRLNAISEAKKTYTGDGTLAYVQRHDGTNGVYEGFSIAKGGKETGKQITDGYKGKSTDVTSLQKQIAEWKKQLDKVNMDVMDKAGMTAARQKYVDGLNANIAKAKQKLESAKPSMSRVEELYSDKKYADFMSRLNTAKNSAVYEAAIKAQDEAIIDGKSVDDIKSEVRKVIESHKKEDTTTETNTTVEEGIKSPEDIVIKEDTTATATDTSPIKESPKTSDELKSELIAKTTELWSKYEDKLGEYKDLVDSIEDVNLETGLKMYKANVQKELDKSKSILDKWKAKLDEKMSRGDISSLDKLVATMLNNYVNPLFTKIRNLIAKTTVKFKLQVEELTDVKVDIDALHELTKAYNDSVGSKEVSTTVGKVVKRVEGAFGPEVEVGSTKTKVKVIDSDKFTIKGEARKDPINSAMDRVIKTQVKAEIDRVLDKGGIEGEFLVNIMGDNYLTADKRLFSVADEPGFLGSKVAKGLWTKSAEEIIGSLPEDFRGFFGKNEEAKKELETNVEVLKEFISKLNNVDIQEAMYKGEYSSARELFKLNPETGVFEAVAFHKVYREKDIEKLKAEGKYTGQKIGELMLDAKGNPIEESGPKSGFNALTLLGKKELVKSNIGGKQVTTGVKISMPDRFNDMIKFYSAKVIADIGSLASEIAYEDDTETAKRYGVQGEVLTGLKELAKNGQVPLVSVLSEPARAIYKQLGIKGTALMPEVTEEAIISSIEALLAASVIDNGLVNVNNYETINGKVVENTPEIKANLDKGKLVSDKSYRIVEVNKAKLPVDKRELVASINKLQYISSSRDRKPPMLKEGADRFDRTMMKSNVPVSELSNTMLNKQEKIPYTLDLDGIKKYMDMSDSDALMALGWKSTDGLHISEVKKRESINDKIEREWDTLKSYYHILGDRKFYLPWGQTISGRDTLVTDLNFQESKLHREFMLAEGKATELDVKELVENPLRNKALIGGVNQGLDLDPDKLSNETTEKVFKEMWKITKEGVELLEGEEADKIRDMWENPNDPKAIAKVFHETEGHHGVKAVETMKKLDEAIKAGNDKVKVTLGVETDAITSGMILTLIQIGTAAAIRLAEKGGLYTSESLAKHTAYVKHWLGDNVEFTPGALIEAGKAHAKSIEALSVGKATEKQLSKLKGQPQELTDDGVFKDLYSTIGIAMVKDVEAYKSELESRLDEEPTDKKLIRQKMLLDEIGELTLSNVRKIAKSPVMVYIYGAEINSIKQKLVYSLGVDTLVSRIKDLRKAIISGDVEKVDKLREFVYKYVKKDAFETVTGSKVWPYEMKDGEKVLDAKGKPVFTKEYAELMALPEEDRLLHVSLEKATKLLSKDIKDSFGKAIENAFKDNLSFVDDNRDRIKAVELMTFEAYKIILKQKITQRLADKGIQGGSKSHLSKEDLEDIQAQMLDEGFAHVATINPEGDEQIHQPLKNDSAKQSLEDMATVHRMVDGKPKASNASIKVRKEMAGTGAAPTITIHMQDGTVMRKTLTLDGDKWRGDNVYDAIITGLDSALMEANSRTYNTEVVDTVFDLSILADNVWKLEYMLNYIKSLPEVKIGEETTSPYKELVHNMSLDGASKNSGLVNDKQRLGLGTNRMIDVLKDAIALSKERQENSAMDYHVAHTFNYGYDNPVTEVRGGEVRSKVIASLDNTNKLLEEVITKDMSEKEHTISVGAGKGKKLPKKISSNDVVYLEDEVTDNWLHKRARELLKDAVESGAKIVNPGMIKDKELHEFVMNKNSAGAKSEKGTINPIKNELVKLMNEHKNDKEVMPILQNILGLIKGC